MLHDAAMDGQFAIVESICSDNKSICLRADKRKRIPFDVAKDGPTKKILQGVLGDREFLCCRLSGYTSGISDTVRSHRLHFVCCVLCWRRRTREKSPWIIQQRFFERMQSRGATHAHCPNTHPSPDRQLS